MTDRLDEFSGIDLSHSFSNRLDAKKLNVLKLLWQRPSLRVVPAPIRAQLNWCIALIGPDTNIIEGL